MSSLEGTQKRPRRTHVVLSDDIEARIADYLIPGDLCSLRATEKNARRRRFSAECNRVEVPRGRKVLQGFWQCYHLPAVTSIDAHGSLIDDEGVQYIARYCPQLSSLNLGYCKKITDAGVIGLGQGGCPQLSSLNLIRCDKITDAGVIGLCQGGCPQLSSLNLYGCDKITDAGLHVWEAFEETQVLV